MRALPPVGLAVAALALAGCSSGRHVPSLGGLPLAGGSRVIVQTKMCNPGANAYCADELVVVNGQFRTSNDFLDTERAILHKLGWTGQYAPNGNEHSDDSPGHKLRVIFATAQGDLIGIDLGWIKRSRSVALALSHAILGRQPTLSMLLLAGASS
jgi:hypothetical protein